MNRPKDGNENKKKTKEELKKRLPLSVNAAILLLFCMLGGEIFSNC
jgi:hypothetical protein